MAPEMRKNSENKKQCEGGIRWVIIECVLGLREYNFGIRIRYNGYGLMSNVSQNKNLS
jgi:hypothetical protein